MKPNICPRCGENAINTTMSPERKMKTSPERNLLVKGDKRRDECMFCHWQSEATWNGHVWKWETPPRLNSRQKQMLDLRLNRVRRKRRAFGGKGRE